MRVTANFAPGQQLRVEGRKARHVATVEQDGRRWHVIDVEGELSYRSFTDAEAVRWIDAGAIVPVATE